jgi:hypothetical protein
MDPVDVAWSILKAAFQPAQGVQIGAGMNQVVFGQSGNPDVVKVSDLDKNPSQLDAMYYNQLLSQLPLGLFAGQMPIEQRMPLPTELGEQSLPILSQQIRGRQIAGSPLGIDEDTARGRVIQQSVYNALPLLEAMNLHDLKPQNWMEHHRASGLMNRYQLTKPGIGSPRDPKPVLIHDPDFGEAGVFQPRRGVGRRRPGVDFEIPEDQLYLLARRADELPFEQFVKPIEESYDDFHEGRGYDALQDRLAQRKRAINRMFSHIGIGG